MAFIMKNSSPIKQEQKPQELQEPQKPNLTNIPKVGFRTVEVTSTKAPNRVIKRDVKNLMDQIGNQGFEGNITTSEAYTNRSGGNNFFERLATRLTGGDVTVNKYSGGTNAQGNTTENLMSNETKSKMKNDLINALKSGKGATVSNGVVSEGASQTQEVKFNPQREAMKKYQDEKRTFNANKNQTRIDERHKLEAEAKATRDKKRAEIEAKKQEKINARNSQSNETPAPQQLKTPFYQKGISNNKMELKNNNKYTSATSAFRQEWNPLSNEKITNENTTTERVNIGGRTGTKTIETRNFQSPGNEGNPKPTEFMSNENWSKFTKENPNWNKGGNRSAKKENVVFDPIESIKTPSAGVITTKPELKTSSMPADYGKPKTKKISIKSGGSDVKTRSGLSIGGGGSYSNGGSGNACGCH